MEAVDWMFEGVEEETGSVGDGTVKNLRAYEEGDWRMSGLVRWCLVGWDVWSGF